MDPIPAPSIVRNVFNDLTAARAHAGKASTNAELERLRQEDQADRGGEIDNAKMQRMIQNNPISVWLTNFRFAQLHSQTRQLPVDPTAVDDRIRRILGSKSIPEKS